MPRWPQPKNAGTWKPTQTMCEIPDADVVTAVAEWISSEPDGSGSHWDDSARDRVENMRTNWNVTLTYKGRTLTTPFGMGSAHTAPPAANDVVDALFHDAQAGQMTFEEFCGDFGYDPDSRSAETMWRTCRDTFVKLHTLFGADYTLAEEAVQG